jgi:hypothetical protein
MTEPAVGVRWFHCALSNPPTEIGARGWKMSGSILREKQCIWAHVGLEAISDYTPGQQLRNRLGFEPTTAWSTVLIGYAING